MNDGSSAVIGSWKTIDTSVPRTPAHLALREREQVSAVEQDAPGGDLARPAGSRRITASAVIDLPQPLSPTRPRISPRPTVNDTSSTAADELAAVDLGREALDGERRSGGDVAIGGGSSASDRRRPL